MSPYRPLASYASASSPGLAPARYNQSFQLADLIRLIHARRMLIFQVAAVVIVLAVITALLLPTTYSGSAVAMLDQRKNNITELSAVLSQTPSDPASLQNQVQLLTSRELAGRVVDRLGLVADPEFNSHAPGQPALGQALALLDPHSWFARDAAPDPARDRDRTIDAFLRHVTADAVGLSTAITITVTSRDPGKAALMANALADAYVMAQVSAKADAASATTGWLNQRLAGLAGQLQAQETAIQLYKAQHGLADTGPGQSLVDQQLVGINAQVVQAKSDLAEKQAIKERIDQLMASGDAADIGQIVSSPLIVGLRTQQAELQRDEAQAASKYGPLHPKMQAIEAQKRDLDLKITQEVNRLAASAANDVLVSGAHLTSLEASLGGTEHTANSQNLARVQLQALESNALSTRTMYEAFVQRLRASQDTDEVQTPESHIISRAAVPDKPSGPKRGLIVGASVPIGLLLGLLAALSVEKIGPMMPVRVNGAPAASIVRSPPRPKPRKPGAIPAPVAVWRGPPILGDIDDTAQLRAADFVLDYPASRYAHAMAALVRQLEVRPADSAGGAAVIALTSADPSESRSAIAVSLARAASKMGKKTILVDCSGQRLSSRALKASPGTGLYEVLTGALPLNQALVKDPRGEVYLLGTPRRPANALTMFASRPMGRLVSILRGGADFVVVDCGPVNSGPEAALIARLADATVLVSQKQMLHAPALANAARILESANAAPIGIVTTR